MASCASVRRITAAGVATVQNGRPSRFFPAQDMKGNSFLARAAGVLLATLALASCTDAPTAPHALVQPTTPLLESAVSAQAVLNVAYATRSPTEKLDIHLPSGTGPFPVVIWLHPGAWQTGDKKLAATSPQLQLLNYGYAVVSVNYRLSSEATFPAQVHDVKAAVRWVRANAAQYRFNAARVGVWGLSSGAHLAALLGTSSGAASLTDLTMGNPAKSDAVKAVVAQAPPDYLLSLDTQLASDGCPKFGGVGFNSPSSPASLLMGAAIQTIPTKVLHASPRHYVGTGDARFLIQHGQKDCTIPWQQGKNLHDRLRLALGPSASTLDLFPTGKHGGTHFTSSANVSRIVTFLRSAL